MHTPNQDRANQQHRQWENQEMLLENKNAVVYGGSGSVGGAGARVFAREGAKVFLAGRTLATLEEVAEEISAAGGVAETAQVDALDEEAVEKHANAVAEKAGGIDISFNAIMNDDVQGKPLAEMPFDDFARPITKAMRNQFLTARAGARHMVKRGSGVILMITGGDPSHTSQILAALLDNAMRYTPKGGSVTVCGRRTDGEAEASVTDTGPGIPPEHLPRIFDRFYRTEEARTRAGGGTGLGLSIARDLARAQDGELTAENVSKGKAGTGAIFRLRLPGS